jgi:phage terminase Nu1 subunit (DNA packaging protein)
MKQSISELSNLTGMDRRRIRKALSDLPADKGKKGALLYESTNALPLLYILPGDGDTYDLTQERARLAHHQANKADLECQVLSGDLISVEEVAEIVGSDYANVRAKLLALPSKAAPILQGLSTAAVRGHLQDLVNEALEELVADETYQVEPD